MDETTLTLDPPLRACWMKVGKQMRIPATRPGKKQKQHIFGGYNWLQDTIAWTVAQTKNSASFIAFLEHLLVDQDAGQDEPDAEPGHDRRQDDQHPRILPEPAAR